MIMSNPLAQMYQEFHCRNNKYGFAHHLTTKGKLLRSYLGSGKKVLDLGSRDGVLTETFSSVNSVTCLELDPKAAHLCRNRLGVEVIQHDLNYPLPFSAESFDVVVAGDVLEHVLLGQQLVREIQRVLIPKGVFLGSTPNAFYWSNRIRFCCGNDPYDFLDPTHVRHFSLGSLKRLLYQQFNQVTIVPFGHHPLTAALPTCFASDFFWQASKD
jgi:2-polyprenyl-3-methyl-5-hydroxy-6-metoxy-1,4-benzoquinol methylase